MYLLSHGKKKKQGFSLLELVVVIGIIGIILGITFRINVNRMNDLTIRNEVAQFQELYNKHLSVALSTSIYQGESYKTQILEIRPNSQSISYLYTGGSISGRYENFSFQSAEIITAEPLNNETLTISHKPYELGCSINDSLDQTSGYVMIGKAGEQFSMCFTISASSCKLKKTQCPQNQTTQ